MWPTETWDAFVAGWQAACATDAVLTAFAGPWAASFAIEVDAGHQATFRFGDAPLAQQFCFAAPPAVWAKFLQPIPPRHHHVALAMLARVPEVRLTGDRLAFAQQIRQPEENLIVGRTRVLLVQRRPNALADGRALAR